MTTAVGYAGGYTPNPTYRETCTGKTGHAEVVLVAYDPERISYEALLKTFWEHHDPTQGMRQGNDVARSTDRSSCADDEQRPIAEASKAMFQADAVEGRLRRDHDRDRRSSSTPFYYAEDYHQQYLDKNPGGYCPNHSTGVKLPDDFVVTPLQYVD